MYSVPCIHSCVAKKPPGFISGPHRTSSISFIIKEPRFNGSRDPPRILHFCCGKHLAPFSVKLFISQVIWPEGQQAIVHLFQFRSSPIIHVNEQSKQMYNMWSVSSSISTTFTCSEPQFGHSITVSTACYGKSLHAAACKSSASYNIQG